MFEGPPAPSYVTYWANGRRITLLESRMLTEAGTTGLRTWHASFVLADWLLANPGTVAQDRARCTHF